MGWTAMRCKLRIVASEFYKLVASVVPYPFALTFSLWQHERVLFLTDNVDRALSTLAYYKSKHNKVDVNLIQLYNRARRMNAFRLILQRAFSIKIYRLAETIYSDNE